MNTPFAADSDMLQAAAALAEENQSHHHHRTTFQFLLQGQQEEGYFDNDLMSCVLNNGFGLKPDPGLVVDVDAGAGWPDFGISRTSSCLPSPSSSEIPVVATGDRTKKRKLDKPQQQQQVGGEEGKRMKGCGDEKTSNKASNKNSNKKENSGESSKENSKVTDDQKKDYIHVRARRGQATDSHSLAERVRREKISERMKYLQDLVPGCNKITGKAGMLDEIINYVQSLQRQVEFLSMKLAAVNPRSEFNIDSLFAKEAFQGGGSNYPPGVGISTSSEMAAAYLQLNSLQQQIMGCCGLDMGMINSTTNSSTADLGIRRTISAPITSPEAETFLEFPQQASIWDADLPSLYNVAFSSQPFPGSAGASNMKMEM